MNCHLNVTELMWCRINTITYGTAHLSFLRVTAAQGIPFCLLSAQISPIGVDSFNESDLRPARHLLDLTLPGISLVDVIKFPEVD